MATETESKVKTKPEVEMDLAGAPCFIERQFPVAKVSMESYKERKANHAQTLTGLGKWWGRKPLVLVRATVLGLLLPATDDAKRDQEIFLKLMTMDDAGMRRRKKDKIDKALLYQYAIDKERGQFFMSDDGTWRSDAEIAWTNADKATRERLFSAEPNADENNIVEGPRKTDTTERGREVRRLAGEAKAALDATVFERMPYSLKLSHCCRPEEISGPDEEAWQDINAHLSTDATSIEQLVEQLGMRRFGHHPRVGDSFCGAGSIPFEAARIGCDVYASDLSPVAALMTWAALNIIGGGERVATEVERVQKEVFDAVDAQISTWGIEHNSAGWRADAFLYCAEVECPECSWRVPLAPSWVIGEKTLTIAMLKPSKRENRFEIEIKQNANPAELTNARASATAVDSRLHCPNCKQDTPIEIIRQRGRGKDPTATYHESGLRLWENEDLVPRSDDVFGERLYCIRWIETYTAINAAGEEVQRTCRHYKSVDHTDLDRESKVLRLLNKNFSEWQKRGLIPDRRIIPGLETARLQRERGWQYWHQLFAPRQLLTLGELAKQVAKIPDGKIAAGFSLYVGKMAERNARLNGWDSSRTVERPSHVFTNQALNTTLNFGVNSHHGMRSVPFAHKSFRVRDGAVIEPKNASQVEAKCQIWVTDPPYADAVSYHELSDFFLGWYQGSLARHFNPWYVDSKHALAVKATNPIEFRNSMVRCYKQLVDNMPIDGLQVVMFTHQDASVWADLSLILWASGLRVTSAWCIATETDSALKQGNYVQGTVLLVCRKRTKEEMVFLDEVNHQVESEVQRQLDEMISLEDDSDPNFGDADYQLAAYAAALRVITERPIEDIDPEKEINRVRPRGEVSPIEEIIRNAVKIACDHLVPKNIDRDMWKTYSPMERFYLKGLEVETHGERRSGVYQELARGFGATNYDDLLANTKANETRLKTATEFAKKMLSGDAPFAGSLTRHVLYAVHTITKTGEVLGGLNWLKTELPNYWDVRTRAIVLLDFFAKLDTVTGMVHWKDDCESASLLAGALRNDHG